MCTKFTGRAAAALFAVLIVGCGLASDSQSVGAQEATAFETKPAQSLAQQIVGTWRLEEASTPGNPSGIGTRLKMFTGTHWCIVQPDAATGVIIFQHGGTYQLDGDTMKTTRDFAGESTKSLIGSTGSLKIKIDGDTMQQADSDGVFNETWKRIK